MPLFEIKTISQFENMYLIEADTIDDARDEVLSLHSSPDFFQRHLSEEIVSSDTIYNFEPDDDDLNEACESIRKRGYA